MASNNYLLHTYSPIEEKVNIITHGLGVVLSLIAFPFLILKAKENNDLSCLVSFCVYGLSLIILYSASTLFHSSRNKIMRYKLNVLDHIAIFVLIAGTYTPYTLITLKGDVGNLIFGIIWGAAFGGIILKLFFTGKYRVLSTIMYVLMGWVALFAFKPLYHFLLGHGFTWLILGGVAYTC